MLSGPSELSKLDELGKLNGSSGLVLSRYVPAKLAMKLASHVTYKLQQC